MTPDESQQDEPVIIKYRCHICEDVLPGISDLRDHLEQHNPNARNISWTAVRNTFTEEGTYE